MIKITQKNDKLLVVETESSIVSYTGRFNAKRIEDKNKTNCNIILFEDDRVIATINAFSELQINGVVSISWDDAIEKLSLLSSFKWAANGGVSPMRGTYIYADTTIDKIFFDTIDINGLPHVPSNIGMFCGFKGIGVNGTVKHIKGAENAETIQDMALQHTMIEVLDFPKAKTIGRSCFYQSYKIKTANLPLAESIDTYAFYKCGELTEIYAPMVKELGHNTFAHCYSLKSVDMPLLERCKEASQGVFRKSGISSFNFPKLKVYVNNMFQECNELEYADLSNATELGVYLFYKCAKLKKIKLPAEIKLQGNTFSLCLAVTEIEVPNGFKFSEFLYLNETDITKTSALDIFAKLVSNVGSTTLKIALPLKLQPAITADDINTLTNKNYTLVFA